MSRSEWPAGRTHRLVDENQWTEHDRRIGARYSWFLLLGFLTAIALTCTVTAPVLAIYVVRLGHGLASGWDWRLGDSALSLTLIIVNFVLPALLARRKRRLNAGRGSRLPADSGAM
ncbi:MAG TPA: hypothetical protein VGM10_18580 [Actinocrinis sp.]